MQSYIDVKQLESALETHDQEKMVARLNRRALHENRLDDTNEAVIRRRFADMNGKQPRVGSLPVRSNLHGRAQASAQ